MTDSPIQHEIADGVARITLNRPERLNAFTPEMHAALRAALDGIEARDDVRCLVLTGAGRGFCTGQDLALRRVEPDAPPPDLGPSLDTDYNPLIRRLRAAPFPVVCAVNGVAAGAGANLALAADIVLAARSARFVQSFARVGLIPDAGGSFWLPRLVGPARALALAMLSEPLDAETAAAWGLIWRCVDDGELAAETDSLAARLAAAPTRGLVLTRHAMDAGMGNDLDAQLDLERDLQRQAGATGDYREGVRAFMDKREPRFRGC